MRRDRPGDARTPQKPSKKPARPPLFSPKMVAEAQREGRERFLKSHDVSRETLARLDRYVALLTEWQARINLVAPSTLGDVWSRHIADSLHLASLLPRFMRCADLGSGGGLPGVVIAIDSRETGGAVDLVESNMKKAAFLRSALRETGVEGEVHARRIEDCGAILQRADVVTARALAPLSDLLALVAPSLRPQTCCFFAKGRQHDEEIAAAEADWRFTMVKHPFKLGDGSVVLEIGSIEKR